MFRRRKAEEYPTEENIYGDFEDVTSPEWSWDILAKILESQKATKKKILVIITGGTIAMKKQRGKEGLMPAETPEEILESIPKKIRDLIEIDVEYISNEDSVDIESPEVSLISQKILEKKDEYDGIVVTHGTDRMSENASKVAFMTKGIDKSVIFTGAMKGADEINFDGPDNLKRALLASLHPDLKGVYVAMHQRLMLAVRSMKKFGEIDAFRSIDSEDCGRFKKIYKLNLSYTGTLKDTEPEYFEEFKNIEGCIQPIDMTVLEDNYSLKKAFNSALEDDKVKFIILKGYGDGNLSSPEKKPWLFNKIKECKDANKVVLVTSDLEKKSAESQYKGGQAALAVGAIPANHINKAALKAKIYALVTKHRYSKKGLSDREVAQKDIEIYNDLVINFFKQHVGEDCNLPSKRLEYQLSYS